MLTMMTMTNNNANVNANTPALLAEEEESDSMSMGSVESDDGEEESAGEEMTARQRAHTCRCSRWRTGWSGGMRTARASAPRTM